MTPAEAKQLAVERKVWMDEADAAEVEGHHWRVKKLRQQAALNYGDLERAGYDVDGEPIKVKL